MAKNKNKQKQSQTKISDTAYMRSGRARKLPIHECFINHNWKESGMASIAVSRKHVNGNISFATFLVDLYCLGVKDAWYQFNIIDFEYREFIDRLSENFEMEQIDYAKAHNIIYGAVAFAEDYGLSPVHDFNLAKMMLEEDTEEIPLIEYEYGVQGKPQLVVQSNDPKLPFYLNKLEKNAGKGNYELVFLDDLEHEDDGYNTEFEDEDEEFFDPESYSSVEWEAFIQETDPGSLFLLRAESFYIYEKAIAAQKLADPRFNLQNLSISYEPAANDDSEEEKAEALQIYTSLYVDKSGRNLNELLHRIKGAIEKWPKNPTFHNYLINAYAEQGELQKQKDATLFVVETFPDYIFGKFAYAQLLIENKKVEEIPKVFNNQMFLQQAYPERKVFHVSELISLNTIMCIYYMEKNDLATAYGYRKMLADLEAPDHMFGGNELLFQIDIRVIMETKDLIIEAKKDSNKRKELIAALVSPRLANFSKV